MQTKVVFFVMGMLSLYLDFTFEAFAAQNSSIT
jgi:hypothetical protein